MSPESEYCDGQPLRNQSLATFGSVDYVLFGAMLTFSASVGVYFGWKDRRKDSVQYMMGGGKVTRNSIKV